MLPAKEKLLWPLALINFLLLISPPQTALSHRIHKTQQQLLVGQQQAASFKSPTATRYIIERQTQSQQNEDQTSERPAAGQLPAADKQDAGYSDSYGELHLESMEDLEHVAHLSMRNFNLTDESLLHSSWLLGSLSNVLIHKQQQTEESAGSLSLDEQRLQLEQKLESFIWHLRNGHLRRPRLDELAAQSGDLQLKLVPHSSANDSNARPQLDRCDYLVHGYIQELERRRKLSLAESGDPLANEQPIDRNRLMSLCYLATRCRTSDELLQLIDGPWQSLASDSRDRQLAARPRRHLDGDQRERDSSSELNQETGAMEPAASDSHRARSSSLRESLSLSLAKLCPLILFQLHDDDGGLCSIRRDDRPPTLRVWGFASLFVTIVSFCSLIGLSITPLLGPTSAPSGHSTSSEPSDDQQPATGGRKLARRPSLANGQQQQPQQHRACLTLFEGLAVGSLVGSALFSLIPQAFELQERESNQGFLLKALIIFFGIYLFFCSERLMRIILDTRQRRKKRKQLRLRSSLPSTTTAEQQQFLAAQQQQLDHVNAEPLGEHQVDTTSGKFQQFYKWRAALNGSRQQQIGSPSSGRSTIVSKNGQHPAAGYYMSQQSSRFSPTHGKSVNFDHQQADAILELDGNFERAAGRQPASKRKGRKLRQHHALSPSNRTNRQNNLGSLWRRLLRAKPKASRLADQSLSSEPARARRAKLSQGPLRRSSSSSCSAPSRRSPERWKLSSRGQLSSHTSSSTSKRHRYPASKLASQQSELDLKQAVGGHHHHHHQAVTIEQDISTVAWMIVLGDGLHNFIDGISIGAAFSESILSGVSISVAVICEEFPHELGDFAVLVSSGMTIRQALGYNFLSACTCYFGMAIGIILGDVNDGASYISALAAGVFLYIALVDMMGELSATLEETSRNSITETLKLLLLQNIGIFIGISIIFILSFIDF